MAHVEQQSVSEEPKKNPSEEEREKISISRLGWNRESSGRRRRCRTDANLKSAAFLSKYNQLYIYFYFYYNFYTFQVMNVTRSGLPSFAGVWKLRSPLSPLMKCLCLQNSLVEGNPDLPSLPRLRMMCYRVLSP